MTAQHVVFDLRDSVLVHKMLELSKLNQPFTLKEVSDQTFIPYKTVERRVARMRQAGLVSNTRLGRRWLWDLSRIEQPGTHVDVNRSFMVIRGGGESTRPSSFTPRVLDEVPHEVPQGSPSLGGGSVTTIKIICEHCHRQTRTTTERNAETVVGEVPHEVPHEAPHRVNDIVGTLKSNMNNESKNRHDHLATNLNDNNAMQDVADYSRKENPMVKVHGPESALKSALEQTLTSPTPTKRKLDSSTATKTTRLKQKMNEKKESEYNVTDMRFVFEQEWTEKKWRGFPPSWTIKDKRLVRLLLNEQGGENTVQYFRYVVKEWESIRRKYKLTGAPSVPILWGYRSSLVHEALNGGAQTRGRSTVEYKGGDSPTKKEWSF